MKKIVLTLAISIAVLIMLVVSVYGAEYTVTSNEEYENAYAQATDGDTIVIVNSLTCDIQANKSITYVLKADWESAKLVINRANVEVSFIADGGNYRIMPTNYSVTEGWMNISEAYENVVINMGGKNGGTVTIDGSNATHDRVSYVADHVKLTLNMLSGSAIANFNPTTKDLDANTSIIYARDINMYEGSSIYANKIIGAPLIEAHNLTLYGGEIFGNVLESTRFDSNGAGAIYVRNQFIMIDGKIYKNILNSKAENIVGFISTQYNKTMLVLGGEIGDNYTTGSGSTEVSAIFGIATKSISYFYYNTEITTGRRFFFTGTPQLEYDNSTGKTIWTVNNYSQNNENWYGYSWRHIRGGTSNVAVFLEAEHKTINGSKFSTYKLIDAYVLGVDLSSYEGITQSNYNYSYTGKASLTIPSSSALWSTSNNEFCHDGREYTLDEVKASMPIVLYTAHNAEPETINGTTMCPDCEKVYSCENPDHELEVLSISYGKYTEKGTKVILCKTCNVQQTVVDAVDPMFICLGYSAPENGVGSIAIGYRVNKEVINEYTAVTGKTLKYGVFAVLQERLGDNDIFGSNGNATEGVIAAEISKYDFSVFELKIVGINDERKGVKLALGAYVAVTNGDATEYSYLQFGTPSANEKYCFTSYSDIVGSNA